MAKRLPIEIVQSLSQQRGPAEKTPLVLLHAYEARSGARISHLPINRRLAEAWITLTGAPFRPHQALALSALRRGEPFALVGDSAAARQTMHLLLDELLLNEPDSSALLLVPNDSAANLHLLELRHLSELMQQPLTFAHVKMDTRARETARARVLVTTPDILHQRLLRYHDRAWQPFWLRLRSICLSDVSSCTGVAAAHLSGLLLRSTRLVHSAAPPLLMATLPPAQQCEGALLHLSGISWRLIEVDDTPRPAALLAVWQSDNDRLYEAASLARALQFEGHSVHIVCDDLETPLLLRLLNQETERITVGPPSSVAQVHIFAGYPGSHAALYQSRTGGAQLTLLLLGTLPIERTLARLPDSLVQDSLPAWTPAPSNAYIAALHLLCAAAERPLSAAEVTAWQAEAMMTRLQKLNQVVRLPDDEAAWQPLPNAGNPYDGFDMHTVGSSAILVVDQQDELLGTLDPSAFDRWGFLAAALPPGRGGYGVVERSDETGMLVVQHEPQQRRTFPLRRCSITIRKRDEQESRVLRGRAVGWGRVMIEEEVFGYREARPGIAPYDYNLETPLMTSWTAPALWISLPLRLKDHSQLVGWSMVAALPLRVLCNATDVVPAYDATAERLYLVDAHPGGNGMANWLYANLETVLPFAYDIALDSRNDALLEPVARLDMDWLLMLLGGERARPASAGVRSERAQPPPATSSAASEQPRAVDEPDAVENVPAEQAAERPLQQNQCNGDVVLHQEAAPPPAPPNQRQSESRKRRKRAAPPVQQPQSEREHRKQRKPVEPPPVAEPAQPEAEPPSSAPDVQAILAHLQHMRGKGSAAPSNQALPAPSQHALPSSSAPRFQAGDHIFCLPYGEGIVRASRIEGNQELLSVEFSDHGWLVINPSISMVRRIDHGADEGASES